MVRKTTTIHQAVGLIANKIITRATLVVGMTQTTIKKTALTSILTKKNIIPISMKIQLIYQTRNIAETLTMAQINIYIDHSTINTRKAAITISMKEIQVTQIRIHL